MIMKFDASADVSKAGVDFRKTVGKPQTRKVKNVQQRISVDIALIHSYQCYVYNKSTHPKYHRLL